MSSGDKLQLISFLNLTQVVNAMDADDDVEFSEGMARLVNVQGLELTRILMEVNTTCLTRLKTLGKSLIWPQRKIPWSFEWTATTSTTISLRWIRRYQYGCFPFLERTAFPGKPVVHPPVLMLSIVVQQRPGRRYLIVTFYRRSFKCYSKRCAMMTKLKQLRTMTVGRKLNFKSFERECCPFKIASVQLTRTYTPNLSAVS